MGQRAPFLHQAKMFVEKNGFTLVSREQNMSFMVEHGMTMNDLRRVILPLEPKGMFDGPEPDRDSRRPRSGAWRKSHRSMGKRLCT